ncbi:MAG TPA: flavodoxin domain-containing protein [Sedimentisphaerales bacterium]|jgi:flavodoxin|nr:flavodoxin domain-containing protein [Sedimentisphaerales bacterium]HNU29659.1 flavodoxin domain-containing protein [Sedimentisphaerales bacterium]
MKTLIVYFSKFGNTRRLAEAMAETFQQAGEARVIGLDQLAASDFEGIDLVVMGSPTHAFTLPKAVRAVLESLPLAILSAKSVAAFDTTVTAWPLRYLRASPKLLAHLTSLGGTPVAKPRTFSVRTSNPQKSGEIDLLLDGELDRARQWAGTLCGPPQT